MRLQAGANDYLVKPFSARELLARVESQLELARVRREGSAALRESEERFRNMADHAPVMIRVTDPAAECTYLNRRWCEFTGQTLEEGLGFGWLDAVHPDDRGAARSSLVLANEQHDPWRKNYRLLREDGEYRWVSDAAGPRFDSEGEFLGYIGSVIDITERRQAEAVREQLLASERAAP